jgi:hypothetical protein
MLVKDTSLLHVHARYATGSAVNCFDSNRHLQNRNCGVVLISNPRLIPYGIKHTF